MKLRTAAEICAAVARARNEGEALYMDYTLPQCSGVTHQTHRVFTARSVCRGQARVRVVSGVWLYIILRYADFYSKEVKP